MSVTLTGSTIGVRRYFSISKPIHSLLRNKSGNECSSRLTLLSVYLEVYISSDDVLAASNWRKITYRVGHLDWPKYLKNEMCLYKILLCLLQFSRHITIHHITFTIRPTDMHFY